MAQQFTLPSIPDEERTPLVNALLGIISLQAEQITKQAEQIQLAKEQIRALRDEVAVLKGLKKKPKIPKSKLEGPGPDGNKDKQGKNGKRPGSAKRSKTSELEIHDSVKVPLEGVNDGWEFKGYSDILTENNGDFNGEKDDLLQAGLTVSSYAQVDDTGQRHEGKNGFCTCISNDLFAFFTSSDSKSRINFLEILRAGHPDYVINEDAIAYMRRQKLKQDIVELIESAADKYFADKKKWQEHLAALGIDGERHVRIVTEAALLASAISHGLSRDLVILSDDAGQFNILLLAHALCWIHAERIINKLVGFNDDQRDSHPSTPLHNNGCETDVREAVTKRKVSGGTQSDLGRRARDTFLSLKRSCRKLGVSFWRYLNDRNSAARNIPVLSQLIIEKAGAKT